MVVIDVGDGDLRAAAGVVIDEMGMNSAV